jgi:phosphoenolpyruvate-protein kinase (PTS system EI component)
MTTLNGIGVTKGVAIGPVFLYDPVPLEIPVREPGDMIEEVARFEDALERALEEVRELHAGAPALLRRDADRLLEAQSLLFEDPALVDRTRGTILQGLSGEQAWQEAVDSYLGIFSPLWDEDMRVRVADLRDVGRRVLAALLDRENAAPFAQARGKVVLAEMLGPAEALQLASQPLLGLCLARGTPTAPAAVIALRLGLPTVIGLGEGLLELAASGVNVVVDGSTGVVEIGPDEEALSYYRDRQRLLRAVKPAFDVTAPAHTADGWRVDVRADLDHPASLPQALARGAEGFGLIRTDFLFLGRQAPPGEEEQVAVYRDMLVQIPEGGVSFCTLSVGQEEPLPFPAEQDRGNPLLGLRGVRLSLAHLSAFRDQLRAILRVAVGRPLTIVFPMIATLAEMRAAMEWLRRAEQDLEAAGVAHVSEPPIALLLQPPLAVLNLEILGGEAAGFYLDLDRFTEYILACDRRNLQVAHLFRPLHPLVLRLVGEAVEAAHRQGKRLEVCGEAAGYPQAVVLLLGLGVDGFCLPPERIPGTKALLLRLTVPDAQELAERALRMTNAPEVESLLDEYLTRRASGLLEEGVGNHGEGILPA